MWRALASAFLFLLSGCMQKPDPDLIPAQGLHVSGVITADEAAEIVMGLLEFRQFAAELEKSGGGTAHAAVRADHQEHAGMGSRAAWVVQTFEDHPDHTVTWNWLYVESDTGAVLVANPVTGDRVSLATWRLKDGRGADLLKPRR